MPTALTSDDLERFSHVLRREDGEALLLYLRGLSLGSAMNEAPAGVIRIAEDHGWTTTLPGGVRGLTSLGRLIADSAREYCNWLDGDRKLPAGLSAEAFASKRVLDVGCGFGRYLFSLAAAGAEPCGIDACEAYLQLSRVFAAHLRLAPPDVVYGRGESLPFDDRSFDAILSFRSLPYMDLAVALGELSRVLSTDGIVAFISLPFSGLCGEVARKLRQRSASGAARQLRNVANSLMYQCAGRRLFTPGKPASPTALPVHVTRSHLRRLLRRVGLDIIRTDGEHGLTWASRIRASRRQG